MNAASNASDTALQLFTGTSAATPNAAGAAALEWEFFDHAAPGFINSVMIMSGRNFASAAFDNNIGAGLPFLPVNGIILSSSVFVASGGTVDVPISVAGNIPVHRRCAVVAREPRTAQRRGSPAREPERRRRGVQRVVGEHLREGAQRPGLVDGTWKIRIHAFNVTGSQLVFWAFFQQM